jgi:hypothetical protein
MLQIFFNNSFTKTFCIVVNIAQSDMHACTCMQTKHACDATIVMCCMPDSLHTVCMPDLLQTVCVQRCVVMSAENVSKVTHCVTFTG